MRRVVVTGMGVVSPLGNSLGETWAAVKAGRSGIGPISSTEGPGLLSKAWGRLNGFRPEDYVPERALTRVDRFVIYAAAAAAMAVEDCPGGGLPEDTAVVFGSSRAGVCMMEEARHSRPSAHLMTGTTLSAAAAYVSRTMGLRGHLLGISNACSSGANAVGEAFRLVKYGTADVAVAGGADAPLCAVCLKGYGAMGALSASGRSLPFDRRRDGFVLSEGSAALVLEERGRALSRGARIYGEVLGYGNASDALHRALPDSAGQCRAIRAALVEARVAPGEVDFVSAHATATRLGDTVEAATMVEVFGGRPPYACAFKSMTGHMLGASGALEAALALLCMTEGVVPPTAGLDQPEFETGCSDSIRRAEMSIALVNSFGFGGLNAALVLRV